MNIKIDYGRDDLMEEIGVKTLKDRYMVGDEKSPQDVFARAAKAFADDEDHAQRLYDYMSKLWFMPSTPILSNGGTSRGMPISCFLNAVEDSIEGLKDNFNECASLSVSGGGIGTYWGDVRPLGSKTSTKGVKTEGIIPFLVIQEKQMLAYKQGSTRRGSAAAYVRVDHPEIKEFLNIRKPTGDANRKALNLHHGVCITDEFMEAVENKAMFDFRDHKGRKTGEQVDAFNLFREIIETRRETGEPYIFFSGNVERNQNKRHKELGLKIKQSNLCTEILLPTGKDHLGNDRTAVCCLSSLNVAMYDEWKDTNIIEDIMRMLDNVLSWYILNAPTGHEKAVYSAQRERSIGLGTMGFHTYLQKKNIPFDHFLAMGVTDNIYSHIEDKSIEASKKLAKERGEAPDMEGTGLRFAHRLAIAPNASSGLICGNVSPSIEPRVANAYITQTLSGTTAIRSRELEAVLEKHGLNTKEVWQQIIADSGSVQNIVGLDNHTKNVFKTAHEIDQMSLINLAAIRQKKLDQGQSLNVFLTHDNTAQEAFDIHYQAWKKGVTCLYYMRGVAISRASTNADNKKLGLNDNSAKVLSQDECLACEG